MRILVFLVAGSIALAQVSAPLTKRSGTYEIAVRLPPEGLYAGEENEIEFHLADVSRIDPVLGATPLIRADIKVTIAMPAMPGMPSFHEQAHAEGVPGDYGIHPSFAHGGEFRLSLSVKPLAGSPFTVEFPLPVGDMQSGKTRKKVTPPFRIDLTSQPKTPKAGEPAQLQFSFYNRENQKQALTEFDLAHERAVHLVVVREDLGTFVHLHPELGAGGVFRIPYTFPTGGEYHIFADVAPKGAGSQVLFAKVNVSGKSGTRFTLSSSTGSEKTDGDLRMELHSPQLLEGKKTLPLAFDLTDVKTGAAPQGMEPYLGARGHLLIVSEDGRTFVHAHPDMGTAPGQVTFLVRLPKPGLYRAWAQFQRNGTVRTASCVLRAE